jgi:wyosine [tRNA(Phe)-imidazoG37] synthetase (radical SAM superfamily)
MTQTGEKNLFQTDANASVRDAISRHPRLYEDNRYVYPVLSRRSHGISIGINLNPDKICNFDCIYCQVDRTVPPLYRTVDEDILENELRLLLSWIEDGTLFNRAPFTGIPDHLKRVNDLAFSGDGEPTSYPRFDHIVRRVVSVRDAFSLQSVKIVVITNCTLFQRARVRDTFRFLDEHNGEIWAKLDAGTSEYYHRIERTRIAFDRIVENIRTEAKKRPLVIQSLFMNVEGQPPSREEIEAYCSILRSALVDGGRLKLIQVYTVARQPAESFATPLTDAEMDDLGALIRERVNAPVEVYYGVRQENA